jgi:hypothetical protein
LTHVDFYDINSQVPQLWHSRRWGTVLVLFSEEVVKMAAQPVLERPIAAPCPGAFEIRRGAFLPDDGYGLVTAPPPLSLAAALTATTVAVAALAVFAVSEIAGWYAARPRGGA